MVVLVLIINSYGHYFALSLNMVAFYITDVVCNKNVAQRT